MHERKTLDRREFTVASVLAALSGVAITISGCGGGSSGGSPTTPSTPAPTPAPTPTPDAGGDVMGTVSANHGHIAVITAARLADPQMVELDITGNADHPHTVELSAAEVEQIADGEQVSKPSSVDLGHNHTVTFN